MYCDLRSKTYDVTHICTKMYMYRDFAENTRILNNMCFINGTLPRNENNVFFSFFL